MATRQYEVAEIRLLADAVQAANFISNKKTKALKDKLYKLISRGQAESIQSQVFFENKLKSDNEEMYYNIDTINVAVQQGVQIEFIYKKRKLTKRMTAAFDEKCFTVNPYALIWINDCYYLICNNPKYDNLMHTRLDRMTMVKTLDIKARSFAEVSEYKEVFDAADYSSKMFNMYSGEVQPIQLRCSKSIIDVMLDRFGSETPLKADGDEHFVIEIQAAVSDGFIAWILQYGASIKVKSPKALADKVKENAQRVLAEYENE
jgi:predicted DNA-binding transcriptional regulator YafY